MALRSVSRYMTPHPQAVERRTSIAVARESRRSNVRGSRRSLRR